MHEGNLTALRNMRGITKGKTYRCDKRGVFLNDYGEFAYIKLDGILAPKLFSVLSYETLKPGDIISINRGYGKRWVLIFKGLYKDLRTHRNFSRFNIAKDTTIAYSALLNYDGCQNSYFVPRDSIGIGAADDGDNQDFRMANQQERNALFDKMIEAKVVYDFKLKELVPMEA